MDEYHVSVEKNRYNTFVVNTIQNFGSEDFDIILLCEDGTSLVTNKRFLSFFSPLIKDICHKKVGNDEEMISIPGSPIQVQLLMDYLLKGEIKSTNENIKNVISLLETLGIESSSEFIKPFKSLNKNLKIEALGKDRIKSKKSMKTSKPKKTSKNVEEDPIGLVLDNEDEVLDNKINAELDESVDKVDGDLRCKYCSKTCASPSILKLHVVKHTKEKNFECNDCGKKFGTPAILYNHRGVHNPIVCEICEGKFSQRANYMKHKATMHQNVDE